MGSSTSMYVLGPRLEPGRQCSNLSAVWQVADQFRGNLRGIKASTFHSPLTLRFPCRLPHSQLALWGSVIIGCAALIAANPLFYEMMVPAARRPLVALSLAVSQSRNFASCAENGRLFSCR